jgi:hypothetical protein
MKRRIGWSLLVGVLVLGGCLPEKKVLWSPDGKTALVRGAEALYLCDELGQLGPPVAAVARSAAWLPDSRRFVVVEETEAKEWRDLLALLSAERRAELELVAKAAVDEWAAQDKTVENFQPQALHGLTAGETAAVLAIVLDKYADVVRPKVKADDWAKIAQERPSFYVLRLGTVGEGRQARLGEPLLRRIDMPAELRVAPDGRTLLYTHPSGSDDETARLFAWPLAGGQDPVLIAEHTSLYADWSADGQFIAYAATRSALPQNADLVLGTLNRRRVCGPDGALLAPLGNVEELAGLLFQPYLRVRCLRDGRVLFSGLDITLPCTTQESPQRVGLFAVDPGRYPGVIRLTPGGMPVHEVTLFEPSPDERFVSIIGDEGLTLIELATGATWPVTKLADKTQVESVWRTRDEVCALVSGPEPQSPPRVVLLKLDPAAHTSTTQWLSERWPKELLASFSQQDQPATPAGNGPQGAAASQPAAK